MFEGCDIAYKGLNLGGFKIYPFELHHNVPCIGFLIEMIDGHRLLYATDTYQIPYKFKNINTFLIESNYDLDIMSKNFCKGEYNISANNNHFSLDNAIDFIKTSYSPEIRNVVLLHLSNGNSNAKEFIAKTKKELSFDNVFVADKGLIIELNKEPF